MLPILEDPQAMMLQPDFVALVMQLFYENEISESPNVATLYEQILDALIGTSIHEIAKTYSYFVSVLPFNELSVQAICKVLPSRTRAGEFWRKMETILEQESIITDLVK